MRTQSLVHLQVSSLPSAPTETVEGAADLRVWLPPPNSLFPEERSGAQANPMRKTINIWWQNNQTKTEGQKRKTNDMPLGGWPCPLASRLCTDQTPQNSIGSTWEEKVAPLFGRQHYNLIIL